MLALNISWSPPRYLPDYYTLYILDLHTDSEQAKYTVEGNASHFYISNITVLGANFEVHLVAHTRGGQNASMQFLSKAPLEVWMKGKLCCFRISKPVDNFPIDTQKAA